MAVEVLFRVWHGLDVAGLPELPQAAASGQVGDPSRSIYLN
jgi:hypothetical protein